MGRIQLKVFVSQSGKIHEHVNGPQMAKFAGCLDQYIRSLNHIGVLPFYYISNCNKHPKFTLNDCFRMICFMNLCHLRIKQKIAANLIKNSSEIGQYIDLYPVIGPPNSKIVSFEISNCFGVILNLGMIADDFVRNITCNGFKFSEVM